MVAELLPFTRRGRPTISSRRAEIMREENSSLRAELRAVGSLVPLQEFVSRNAAIDGSPPAANAALIVLDGLRRVQRRYPDDGDAA